LTPGAETPDTQIAIIGSGFGGLGAAIRLRQRGFTDFLIFERESDVARSRRPSRSEQGEERLR
jgi:cation diffusion facilitator CzcD-associated flavoprotein CzcO